MYHIGICDDDPVFIKYMKRLFSETYADIEFYEYLSGEELIEDIQAREKYDALILDVAMPGMDGNETARNFRKYFPDTLLVFCSGVCMPTVESFETTPYRYWLKKYSEEKMRKEVEGVVDKLQKNGSGSVTYVVCKKEGQLVRLSPENISYIAIARKGSSIYGKSSKEKYTSPKKLVEFYEQLKDYGFAYAHNSYIVNLKYVATVGAKDLELVNGEKLTVSRARVKEFQKAFAVELSKKYEEEM